MKRTLHKALSMLLTAAIALNMGLTPVFAEGVSLGVSGLTDCHTAHDSECGYTETVTMGGCTHEHGGDCGYTEGTAEQPCAFIPNEDAEASPADAIKHEHDETCGYAPVTEGTPCTHEHNENCGYGETITVTPCTHTCEVCEGLDTGKPEEKVCTCPPVDSGELVHGENCPLYVAPEMGEAVKTLIAMVDALPNAAGITEDNKETIKPTYEAVTLAYEALSPKDKAAFEATEQYAKLMALQSVLFGIAQMLNKATLNISTGDLTLTDDGTCGGHIVTGTTTEYKILVQSGTHDVKLDGVSIDVSTTENACAFEISNGAAVNLTLANDNTLKSGENKAGLQASTEATLMITATSTGSLAATGGYSGAGIGGGSRGEGGTITIMGGTVTAKGGDYGAGIGGGPYGTGGTIIMSGGTVTAKGGAFAAGIGGGSRGEGVAINISGGTVTATGGNSGAGIGGGAECAGGIITISDNAVVFAFQGSAASSHIGAGDDNVSGESTVNRNGGIIFEGTTGELYAASVTPTDSFTIPGTHMLTIESGKTLTINSSIAVTNNGTIIKMGTIDGAGTITGNQPIQPNPPSHDISTSSLVLDSTCGGNTCVGHTVTGTTTTKKIIVQSGTHDVTLDGVQIDMNGADNACSFEIADGATVSLTLTGDSTLKSGKSKAGLQVSDDATLVITEASTGSLAATGGDYGAGIGGGDVGTGGSITIHGGTVTATGGILGAGIGGGSYSRPGVITIGGHITIDGGTVTATGGIYSAGIGGGCNGVISTITILRSTVTATGGDSAAGIGSGRGVGNSSAIGKITISDNAVVFATAGNYANHIGAGLIGAAVTVNRNGGIIFEGTTGELHAQSVTPNTSFTIPDTHTLTIKLGKTLTISSSITVTNNGTILNEGTIDGDGTIAGNPPILSNRKIHDIGVGDFSLDSNCGGGICVGHTINGNTSAYKIIVQSGTHDVKLDGVSIDVSTTENACAFEISNGAAVNLTLANDNTLKSGRNKAGLQASTGATLMITATSTGSLAATGGDSGAGIGGGDYGAGGTITMSGGTVTAKGGRNSAGIGGGTRGAGGTVTISDNAVVFAAKGVYAPKHIGEGDGGTAGTVNRNGGIIFEGDSGKVHGGNVTLGADTTIPTGKTLTLEEGKSVLIPANTTLTNDGTIDGTGFVSLLSNSAKVGGSGTDNTRVKKLLTVDNTTIADISYGTLPVVKWDGLTLTANTDFTISGIVAGTDVPVTVTGNGGYHGIVTKNINVNGSGGGGIHILPPDNKQDTGTPSTGADAKVPADVDKNGNATATIQEKDIADAIKKVKSTADKNGITVNIKLESSKAINSFSVILPKAIQKQLVEAKVRAVIISSGNLSITLDWNALSHILTTAKADITVTATKVVGSALSKQVKAATGGKPVYDFKVTCMGKKITTFGKGKLSLSIPYTLQKVDKKGKPSKKGSIENSGNLVGVSITGAGKPTYLPASSYNATSKAMLINTTHLSLYGVVYKTNAPTFTDTTSHWAKNNIQFVAARGLIAGTTAKKLSPNSSMNRGMFVTALSTLSGKDMTKVVGGNLTDTVTREEMAVIMQSYAKAAGYKLPSVHKEITFSDSTSISTSAKVAVKEMQMAGILMGKDGGKFDPTGTATRAQGSAMLRRFVELVANSKTAEGWVQNDSGNWMYFKNGKPVTGKKKIDGTTYEFDRYGATAQLSKDKRNTL